MPIANRNLKAGTVLVANYLGKEHRATVVKTKDGLRYRLKDGSEHKSPSSAGAAVKGGGKTCDGWEFWSVEGATPVPRRAERQAGGEPKAARKATRTRTAAKKAAGKAKPTKKAKAKRRAKPARDGANPEQKIGCGQCDATFKTTEEAAEHVAKEHPIATAE